MTADEIATTARANFNKACAEFCIMVCASAVFIAVMNVSQHRYARCWFETLTTVRYDDGRFVKPQRVLNCQGDEEVVRYILLGVDKP